MKFPDQIGNTVSLSSSPKRIISLVPSQTELLFDLGLDEDIVGITRYCVHPKEKCARKPRIGGTKKFDFDLIDKLKPELILGNREENYKEGIERLLSKYPVWMSDIITLEDAYDMIVLVGEMVGRKAKADEIVSEIKSKMDGLENKAGIKVAYFMWRKPYMVAGGDTFINEMIKKCGLVNVFENIERYPEVTLEQVEEAKPDIILLSSEPFPFKEKHFDEFREKSPSTKIMLVDGEMFSWYGSRLIKAARYFRELRKDLL